MKALFAAVSVAGASPPVPPLHGPSIEAVTTVQLGLSMRAGEMPPFSASERDVQALELGARWSPHPAIELRAGWEGLRATWPQGETVLGSGDLRLGTHARPYDGNGAIPAIWVDWDAKLPNAPEDSGLGTDETDLEGLVLLAWQGESWRVQAGGGLAILGSPVQHAAQDDAALVLVQSAFAVGPTWVSAGLDGRLRSPRNPLDLRGELGVGWTRGPLQLGAEGVVGLSPAAPTWGARVVVGLVRPPEGS